MATAISTIAQHAVVLAGSSEELSAVSSQMKGNEIASVITQINETQSSTAGAVEEQTATTSEISRNVQQGDSGSTQITEDVIGVARSAQEATDGAANTEQAATELSRLAGDLQQLVGQFRY
jgi:methyl-accepting chemotaxis protein